MSKAPAAQLRASLWRGPRAVGRAKDARAFAESWLLERANEDAAKQMNAYMRCEERGDDVRCVGVTKTVRKDLNRVLKKAFAPSSPEEFERIVRALWHSDVREARMSGAEMCRFWPRAFFGPAHLELYRELIEESGWWDLADIVAAGVVPRVIANDPAWRRQVTPVVTRWRDADNVWLRRACLLSQLFSKEEADVDLLFANCRARWHEEEFFIRKAIGWALREASKCFPDEVEAFLRDGRASLSGLSFREGAKVLRKEGRLLDV